MVYGMTQIGHLGNGQFGSVFGDININAGGDISIKSGAHTRNHAAIGHTVNGYATWNPSDNLRAEARFLETVIERHPQAEGLPAIIGNCQAGWALLMLAAVRPELCGPLISTV